MVNIVRVAFVALTALICVSLGEGFVHGGALALPSSKPAACKAGGAAQVGYAVAETKLAGAAYSGDNGKGPFGRLFNTCESDTECEGMEFCCDFLFMRMCCTDGLRRDSDLVPALVPIPVPVDPYGGYGGYGGR